MTRGYTVRVANKAVTILNPSTVVYVRNHAVFAIFSSRFCSLNRSWGHISVNVICEETSYIQDLSSSIPPFSIQLFIVGRLLLPSTDIKVESAHLLHAFIFGQTARRSSECSIEFGLKGGDRTSTSRCGGREEGGPRMGR